MANYSTLKAAIDQYITANGNNEITGTVLNNVLDAMVNSLGANYQFAGIATPSTNPGTPDQNVFYLAMEGGTYTNFNGTVLPAGISMLMWNGTWTSETVMYGDGGVFDISVYKSSGGTLAKYADLAAALDGGNNIPVGVRKGGMSVKFVQSSDNKYVQYFLTKNEWSINKGDWEKINLEEEVSQLGQKVDDLLIWDERSLIYSDTAPNPHISNLNKTLKYVHIPDISDDVYVSFYKYTTSGGEVNLGRIRLSKVSDGSQVFINYVNTSIERISGGLYDGCYKCWVDSTKYIIIDPVLANVESTITTQHFIVNPELTEVSRIKTQLSKDTEDIKKINNTIVKDSLWDSTSKVYDILLPNEGANITLTRAFEMIKGYNLYLAEKCYVYFFQVTHENNAITNCRIGLRRVSDNTQVFINYVLQRIEQISVGKYAGCYKCYVGDFRYIIIDDSKYSSLATIEFNDNGTNKWLVAKNTISDTIKICASNSVLVRSEDFDLYCDGYDDNVEIEYALTLIPTGGRIELSDGLFNIGTINDGLGALLNKSTCSGISFSGQGRGVTTLKLQPSGLLVDGKDLSGEYDNNSFTFNVDNQPTLFNGEYRSLKCAVYDKLSALSSYTITINGTDKDDNVISASQSRSSASTFVRLWFGAAQFKTITSIVFSNVTYSRQPGLLRFCLAYSNSENNIFRFVNLDNILVEDLTLDGNYENEEIAYLSTDSIKNGISMSNCRNVTIRNIESSNFFHHGVIGVGCENVHQENCILNGNGHRATHYHNDSKNIIFVGNYCKDNGRNHGRNLDSGTSGVFIMYSNNDCIVKDNIIEGDDYCSLDIQQENINNNSYGRVIVSGNICRSTYDTSVGIQVLTNRTAQHLDGALDGLIISDNIVETKASGILITNAAVKNMVVKGNVVKMGGNGYLALGIQGIAADAVDGLSVTGNVVSGGNSVIISNVINAAIVGNVFDATNVSISGNNIVNDNNAQ